jgi:hypothetical protein
MADPFTSSPAARSADDLSELRSRLAALEQKERDSDRQRRRRRITAAACALGVALTAGTVAMAAPGDCPNGMPFCFAPDSPASAAQVNENFAHVRGLNAAWASRGTSINLNTGPRSVVTSVTVPAGSYVVSGKLYGFAPAGANLLCSLTDPAGTGFDTTNSHPSNNYASVSLLGTVTLATGGSISIQCQTQGSVAYTLYSVALVVTPVSALN